MQILSHGVKKPETGDKGSVWFPAMEDNCDILNDHNHDGSNSEPIPSTSISPVTQAVSSASWASVGAGTYRQLLTVPNGKTFDNSIIIFRHGTSKKQMYLDVEPVSSNTYYVYINDSTVSVTAFYVS